MIRIENRYGTIEISQNYFRHIIGEAVSSCYGVVGMVRKGTRKGLREMLSRKAMIEDGKAFSFHDQDEYRQALQFMNKLVKEGLLSTLAFTGTQADLRNMLNFRGGPWPATVGICCAWIRLLRALIAKMLVTTSEISSRRIMPP